MNNRELFLKHIGQTSPSPIGLEIVKAEGTLLYDASGKKYLDLIGGISVCNTGHRHPKVVEAIKNQVDEYLHILVYGEFVQAPQVQYAGFLIQQLASSLNSVYFTNSGAEAVEGAMKLAKRVTGRTQICAFKNSYHGSTQGALSILGDEYWRNAFRPLLPDVLHLDYNSFESLQCITKKTACVIAETVQAEKGVNLSTPGWMKALHSKCRETGTLFVLDEIQTGFGRTGTFFSFEHLGIVPDVLLLGKALGGGMPLGAFIADQGLMRSLTENPVLGHITTFGGHPVSCAAGLAAAKVLVEGDWIKRVNEKEKLFRSLLVHPKIRNVRSAGLLIAVEFDSFETNKKIIDACLRASEAALTDWFLFASNCMRIAPPLSINAVEIRKACEIILKAIDE
jgi:acetylornithine/succinyldiaminopimelate/putrescine aminotransferase